MYINSTLGKTPKWIKNIDRSVRDAGKSVDKSVRRVAEDVSDQHKRNRANLAAQHRRNLKNINLEDKTPGWMKATENELKRSVRKSEPYISKYAGFAWGGAFATDKHRRTAARPKGAPGSQQRADYHDDVEAAQRLTAATVAAAATSAYFTGPVSSGAAGTGAAGGGAGSSAGVTAGQVGAALSTAATTADKINDALDPFNPDAVGNIPASDDKTKTPASTNIPWIPLAIAAGFLFL